MALPPEWNAGLLFAGLGPGPLMATAAAYQSISVALAAAASASDASMGAMSVAWSSPAAEQAQQAFGIDTAWLRTQAENAGLASYLATMVAGAIITAWGAMPKVPEINAVKLAEHALVLTNNMGQNTPAIAGLESVYLAMWVAAAMTMASYAADAGAFVSLLPPPATPPPIAGGNPVGAIPADLLPSALGGAPAGIDLAGSSFSSLPGGGTGAGVGAGPVLGGSAPRQVGAGGGETQAGGGPANGSPGQQGGGSGQSTPPGADASQPVSVVQQALPPAEAPSNPGADAAGGDGTMLDPASGFHGSSPNSTTLAGLNGGVGSVVPLGMTTGGAAAMSGTATGFRMPTTWTSGATRAFGSTASNATSEPIAQRTAPRGASAPEERLRRRRDPEEHSSTKAFSPGEPQEAPTLEQSPAIGVIGYSDTDAEQESATEQLLH
ncbi:PPE family protein [Nocardia sp. NBC_01327]|uniref:PPE family protein n=1 Tax=Nocardia sp. NBC_01327 TaxID=2903593 RepID=UPI003FA398E1